MPSLGEIGGQRRRDSNLGSLGDGRTYQELLDEARAAVVRDKISSLEPPRSFLSKLGETWPAKLAQAAYQAATLPGDVYAGRTDPMSDEGIGRAADLAGLVMTGGIGGVARGAGEVALGAGPARRMGKMDFERILKSTRSSAAANSPRVGDESIAWAAVRDKDGRIYQGAIHKDAENAAVNMNKGIGPDTIFEQGFTTNKGRFVSRAEAAQIAEKSGQVHKGYANSAEWLDAADYYNPQRGAWWETPQVPQLDADDRAVAAVREKLRQIRERKK